MKLAERIMEELHKETGLFEHPRFVEVINRVLRERDRCLAKVEMDEPVFILRAQDESSPDAIAGWIALNRQYPQSQGKVKLAEGDVIRFQQWQLDHKCQVKRPD